MYSCRARLGAWFVTSRSSIRIDSIAPGRALLRADSSLLAGLILDLEVLGVCHSAACTLSVLALVVFHFLHRHTVTIQGFFETTNCTLWLLVALNDMALQAVDSSPINTLAVIVITA
jgi:hypothetical protein